jgi:thioredoxin reductase/NAD-dependent dihydropyrimidine dehydrogenase PreA subunit
MTIEPLLLVYAGPLAALWLGWTLFARRRSARDRAVLADNVDAGLHEPPSLHPVIDPALCLGCGACARACPEKTIIGIIDGKAALIEPSLCIGHGACQTACPTHAITLVFGTETRGVDIPVLTPEFETSVRGIFVAGELGGMGLIKNAIEQGRQAIGFVAKRAAGVSAPADALDTVIVGCGPAGIAASLGAIERGLTFVTLDQATMGGTVAHFPRGKLVMTAPAMLPIIGQVRFAEISKERLLAFWEDVLTRTGLAPRFEEPVQTITRRDDGLFEVVTPQERYVSRTVLLAIGRRGSPRPLGVPGEALSKVVYRLIDAEQYARRKVLVVGGGDSALEAAISLVEEAGAEVTLAFRGTAFTRARARNREKLAELVNQGRVAVLLQTEVCAIGLTDVTLDQDGEIRIVANEDVIICAGGLLPTQFLHNTGICVETKFGVV